MNTELKLHHVSPDALLRHYVERRLNFVLGRFGHRIGRVTTRISENASGAARELVCRMSADLHPLGIVTAEASDPDVYTAIDRCAGRLSRQCESKLNRLRSIRTRRTSIRVPGSAQAA